MRRPPLVLAIVLLILPMLGWASPRNRPILKKPRPVDRQLNRSVISEVEPTIQPSPSEPKATSTDSDAYKLFNFPADPNEDSEVALLYWKINDLLKGGQWQTAQSLAYRSIKEYPESRHLHSQLAEVLWYLSGKSDPTYLQESAHEAQTALMLGEKYRTVDSFAAWILAQTLGRLGKTDELERAYSALLRFSEDPNLRLYYAMGISLAAPSRAPQAFEEAIASSPNGLGTAEFAEWLISDGEYAKALTVLSLSKLDVPYLHLERAVALEHLGWTEQAKAEYKIFANESNGIEIPTTLRISGSKLQEHFDTTQNLEKALESEQGISLKSLSDTDAINGLSMLIQNNSIKGEAPQETVGGQRSVAWEVRDRVIRGKVGANGCPSAYNSGTTWGDKYKSVMCASSQFVGMCSAWCSDTNTSLCPTTVNAQAVASDVYNGYAPDPVGGHCPGGIQTWGGSFCADTTRCVGGYKDTYRLGGPLFNLSKGESQSCNAHFCAPTSNGKICSNGSADNCFYSNSFFGSNSGNFYTSSLSGTGTAVATTSYYASISGTHRAHLEGAENTSNPDFDLYLQTFISPTGQWSTVQSHTYTGTVEDITYSGTPGTYRWLISSYSGSGSFTLNTITP
jgi:tetratricopeptide (TPR) repeat protein